MNFPKAIRETKTQIVAVLNQSGLPIDVMDYILKEIHESVHRQAEDEYRRMEEQEARAAEAAQQAAAQEAPTQENLEFPSSGEDEGPGEDAG